MVNQFYITLAIYDCIYNAALEYCSTIESTWTVIHQFTTTLFIFLWYTIHFSNVAVSAAPSAFVFTYMLHKKKVYQYMGQMDREKSIIFLIQHF